MPLPESGRMAMAEYERKCLHLQVFTKAGS